MIAIDDYLFINQTIIVHLSEIQKGRSCGFEPITCTMGKRYYCDYCDRSFQDNMHNRKKHLNGVQHHRAKKAWFDHFRGQPCSRTLDLWYVVVVKIKFHLTVLCVIMCIYSDPIIMDTHVTHFRLTDASALLYDEQSKKPCRKFLQKGNRTV